MPRMTLGGEKKQPGSRYGALFNNMGSYAESESKPETPEAAPAPVEETATPVTPEPVVTPEPPVAAVSEPETVTPAVDEDSLKALQANLEQPAPTSDAYSYGYDDADYEEEYEDFAPEEEETEEPTPVETPAEEAEVETPETPEAAVESEEVETPASSVSDETEEPHVEELTETQETSGVEEPLSGADEIQVIIDLYEAIRNLTPEDKEALNALLGNHTDSTPAQTILSIVENADQTAALLKAVSELATVDTSNPNRAVAKYVILLSKHTTDELQTLNTILHDNEPETVTEDNRDDVLETLAVTLATTPPNVFGAAHTIRAIIE